MPATEPGQPATAYTGGPGGTAPMMGLGFFVLNVNGHRYIYHDGDQGGFTAEFMIDPDRQGRSIVMSNTTDTGAPDRLHPRPIQHRARRQDGFAHAIARRAGQGCVSGGEVDD